MGYEHFALRLAVRHFTNKHVTVVCTCNIRCKIFA